MSDLTPLHFIAYLDPGTGSLIVQFLLGAVVGTGVWFRKHVIATVAGVFRFGRKGSEKAPEEAAVQSAAVETSAARAPVESDRETPDDAPRAGSADDTPEAERETREDVTVATR